PINASAGKIRGISGNTSVQGLDPNTFTKVWKPEVKKGPADVIDKLGPRDAVVVDDWANSNDVHVGDRLVIETPLARNIVLTVRGTVGNKGNIFSSVSGIYETVRREFHQPDDAAVLIKAAPGANVKAVQARINGLLDAQFPIVKSQDQQQYKDDFQKRVNQ